MCDNLKKYSEVNKHKLRVTEAEIVAHGTVDKPYFVIKYKEVDKKEYNIGFGSYNLKNVFGWLEDEFEIVEEWECDDKPVDMDDMKKRVQTNLLIARKEMHDTNTLTVNAMICIVDALFYLVQNIGEPKEHIFHVQVPEGKSIEDIMKDNWVGVDMGIPGGDQTINVGVCKTTGNYCSMCTLGPCEHRKV